MVRGCQISMYIVGRKHDRLPRWMKLSKKRLIKLQACLTEQLEADRCKLTEKWKTNREVVYIFIFCGRVGYHTSFVNMLSI